MRLSPRQIAVCLAAGFILGNSGLANLAYGQLPQTRLQALYPAGGQVGQTVEVTVTSGIDLEGVDRLSFSHPGITAVRKTQMVNDQPQPVEKVFLVAIAPNVPAGIYEARVAGPLGQSNPRFFSVGTAAEVLETEPNNTFEQANPVELNRMLNGRMNAAIDVDCFKFIGKKDQRILAECFANRIDSRFDATLELSDATGRRLESVRNNLVRDALLDVTLPADGEYRLKVYDFTYAGGEDYFYRINLTTGPHIDFVMPPAGAPGSNASYTLYGRNLPGGQPSGIHLRGRPLEQLVVSIPLPTDDTLLDGHQRIEPGAVSADGIAYSLPSPQGASNSVFVGFSHAPIVMEVEPNNDPQHAQRISIPAEVAGQFQTVGDVDYYQFEAHAKETLWIEVLGQKQGTGVDPYFILDQVTKNDKGVEQLKRITTADDDATNLLPIEFETVNDDPVFKFVVPENGEYRLAVRDRYSASRGNPALVYRLVVRRETPDFRVVVVPNFPNQPNQKQAGTWSLALRKGDNISANVLIFRRDGFTGPVTISAEGLPPGVTCREITLQNQAAGLLVFSSTPDAPTWSGTVKLLAKAWIDNPEKVAAFAAAEAAIKPAAEELEKTSKGLPKPQADLQVANEALAAAKIELNNKPDDAGLKQKVEQSEQKIKQLNDQLQAAVAAHQAAEQKLSAAKQTLEQARVAKQQAGKEVVRVARSGTIAWGNQQNLPGQGRLTQELELSVIEEAAPIQLTTDVHRVEVNHGRQVLIPLKVHRRGGFDNTVQVTFAGVPQNVQVENKPINKGKDDELYRLFIPNNAAVGTYVVTMSGQAQVSYRKLPERLDKAKEADKAAETAQNAVQDLLKGATTARDEAVKQLQTFAEQFKQASNNKADADKKLAEAQTAHKAAEAALSAAGENAEAKANAEKKLQETAATQQAASDAVANAEKARVDAEAKQKAAEATKGSAEATFKQAEEKLKAAMAQRTATQQKVKDAETLTKANNINYLPPSTPIVLTIKEAPLTVMSTNVPNGGNLKRNEQLEVKVEIKRINGFTGPVRLALPLPPNAQGLSADVVTIPAENKEGTLVIKASADATEGQLANLVIRMEADFQGAAAVDAPLAIKVNP